jgi:hypothetical protein
MMLCYMKREYIQCSKWPFGCTDTCRKSRFVLAESLRFSISEGDALCQPRSALFSCLKYSSVSNTICQHPSIPYNVQPF